MIKSLDGVFDQLLDGVIAGRGIAAAVAAHIDTKNPITGRKEVRDLLGPHPAISRQRMREIDDGRIRPPHNVKVNLAPIRQKKHFVHIRPVCDVGWKLAGPIPSGLTEHMRANRHVHRADQRTFHGDDVAWFDRPYTACGAAIEAIAWIEGVVG